MEFPKIFTGNSIFWQIIFSTCLASQRSRLAHHHLLKPTHLISLHLHSLKAFEYLDRTSLLLHRLLPKFSSTTQILNSAMSEYGNKMSELSKRIVKAVLISMGDDFAEKFYESDFNKCHGYMRINKYSPAESAEEVEGLGMHTDMSCMTIVCQDDIGGLQVRSKLGKWMDINPCEDTLVVNIGDLMHAWSNGKLRSSEHRVVLRRQVHRFSLAFFWCFEDDKVIFAPNEVVGEGNLRMYKPFVCRDYLNFRESSEKGKFDKVGFTIKDFAVDQEKL
eukprot:XP_025014805.1 gibberellin 20-oxidase-like protein isoform X2 [Ricinus communis]